MRRCRATCAALFCCSRRLIRVGAGGGARGAGNLGMAWSRPYLQVHWLSDVVADRVRDRGRSPSSADQLRRRDPRTTAGFGPLAQSVSGSARSIGSSSIATSSITARDAHRAPPAFPSRSLPSRRVVPVRVAPVVDEPHAFLFNTLIGPDSDDTLSLPQLVYPYGSPNPPGNRRLLERA